MNIVETDAGAVALLAPQGPLTGDEATQLRASGLEALKRRRGRVVLDLSAVPYADSVGLEALLDLTESLAETGRALKIIHPSETLRTALDLVGIAPRFEFHADATAALRSFL